MPGNGGEWEASVVQCANTISRKPQLPSPEGHEWGPTTAEVYTSRPVMVKSRIPSLE